MPLNLRYRWNRWRLCRQIDYMDRRLQILRNMLVDPALDPRTYAEIRDMVAAGARLREAILLELRLLDEGVPVERL